jgi:hypothetical protein
MGLLVQLKTVSVKDIAQSTEDTAFFATSTWGAITQDFAGQPRYRQTL